MIDAKSLLQQLLASQTRGDLLVLFHRNPGLIDTMDGVARRIGRTGFSIEEDVRGLVSLGVLRMRKIGNSEVVLLDRAGDRRALEAVANHLGTVRGTGES